ncbi:hypothetical protein BCR43DRAFT_244974 [Syncephalastrum racemosum]|uniref:Uncharacterized protein n=1 Tax=Syncephalastrum racemosum TaxID=13706 RepID=A0A1X2HF55_SYNRA|nr:hypothetical protein BCR43DRAFT_244974 [Syncephalastrum racemosum]
MKAKVKLYNHKLRSGSGRIYDIYEIGHPYSQQQRRDQARQEQAEECDATAAALNVTTIRKAYQADYQQATLILQAIEANERKPISHECIRHLATFVVHAWEVDPNHGKVQELEGVMHHLLGSTRMDNNEHDQLENAIKQYCRNSVATPTVCPNVTLLIAVHYVDRLKKVR